MSLLDALDRVEKHQLQPYVAPIFDAGVTETFVVQDAVPYRFKVRGVEPGWYVLDGKEPVREAMPNEYLPYMSNLRRFYAIALFPVSDSTWLVSPYNASDAEQRGWRSSRPLAVHNVRGALRPLDVIDARVLGGNLLYFTIASSVERDTRTPDFKRASEIFQSRLEAIRKERAKRAWKEQKKKERQSVEAKFEHQLALVGADLIDWKESGENRYEVTWEYNGAEFTVPVRRSGILYSAGICVADHGRLGDTADMHDLGSAVDLMENARKMNRFDLDRELWL